MVKKDEYKDKIIENLLKSSQSLKILTKKVKDDLGEVQNGKRNTQFKEAIMELLKDGEIILSGYDFDVHNVKEMRKNTETPRIQADIKIDGIKLELIRTEQTYVISLLNQLEGVNKKKVMGAYDSLKELFRKKTKQLEDLYFVIWEKEISKVDYWVLSKKIKELKEVIEEQELYLKITKDISPTMYSPDSIIYLPSKKLKTAKGKLPETVYYNKPIKPIELIISILEFSIDLNVAWLLKWEGTVKKHQNAKLWFILDDDGNPSSIKDEDVFLDKNGSISNPEIALNLILDKKNPKKKLPNPENLLEMIKPESYTPVRRSKEEIDYVLRQILFYINLQDHSKFLKTFFSLALSDDQESLNWFEYFFKNIPLIIPSLEKKLSEDLKVVPQFEWKPYTGPDTVEEGFQARKLVQNW